ncbi:MAG: hypothetical protein IMX00_00335 [Limnochordales bacterium]|nr:hypothetical protein [Limnochordales bacterium]
MVNGSNHASANMALPGQADERGLRRYTAEEDERILREWWQKEKRPQLIRELGRTKAALAQRYYLLLREMGVTPEEHRRQQLQAQLQVEGGQRPTHARAGAATDASPGLNQASWTPEREAFLWRQARSGTSFEEIAEILGGVTPGECRARYLLILQQTPGSASERVEGEARSTSSRSESTETGGELWTTLAALPERLAGLEAEQARLLQRVAVLESAWSGLVAGLQEIIRVLPAASGNSASPDRRGGGEPVDEAIRSTVRELSQSLHAFLCLGHWDKIRQLPVFLSSLDEKLKQLEERVALP